MLADDDELLEVDGVDTVAAAHEAVPVPRTEPADELVSRRPALPVIAQAAALATAGFAAGAVTAAVVRSAQTRRAARRRPRAEVIATRSFLIDVHVLQTRD